MDARPEDRYVFVCRAIAAAPIVQPPRRTQLGIPEWQEKLKTGLPLAWLAWFMQDARGELHGVRS